MKRLIRFGAIAFAVFFVVIVVLAVTSSPADEDPTAAPVPPTPPPSISAVDLYAEREANATRFDMERKGNWVTVTGMVGRVESGDVWLVTDLEAFDILGDVFLDHIALQDLPDSVQASVNKGDQFTAPARWATSSWGCSSRTGSERTEG